MASFKKELKAIVARFDAAQEAFNQGTDEAAKSKKKSKKKLKSAKAKIKSLEQKIASLEQQLKVAKDKTKEINSTAGPVSSKKTKSKDKSAKSKSATKSTGARLGRRSNTTPVTSAPSTEEDMPTAEEMATAVSDAPDSVSEAAAEKTTPKPRRGRPSAAAKKAGETKAKAPAGNKPKRTGRRGRPSTKAPASPLTKIAGVGTTMATRFEESGVTSVEQFSKLSDDEMKEVLLKCGPRYRSADHDRMEGYRQAATEAMNS